MPEKLKSFWENRIFHSVMTKNWTHDLPVDKGAFEGGSLGGNRADEHFLLSVGCLKVWNFPRHSSFFPKEVGDFPSFPPRGQGGLRRGSTHYVTNYVSDLNKGFITLGSMSLSLIFSEIQPARDKSQVPALGALYRALGAPEEVPSYLRN